MRRAIANRFGFWSAILTAVFTTAYLGLNFLNPPSAWRGIDQYVETFTPPQMLWLIPAFLLALTFVVLVSAIHSYAPADRRIFSQTALAFASMYATLITANYFIQLTVVRPAMLDKQAGGLALLAMANPKGVFFAFETLAYLIQELAFLSAAFVFVGDRLQLAIRWSFLINFAAGIASLVGEYALNSLPIIVASVLVWAIALVASAVLLAVLFSRRQPPATYTSA
jgi:hypothetical protein